MESGSVEHHAITSTRSSRARTKMCERMTPLKDVCLDTTVGPAPYLLKARRVHIVMEYEVCPGGVSALRGFCVSQSSDVMRAK